MNQQSRETKEEPVKRRVVCWFSCGAASAVATKLALRAHPDAVVVRTAIAEEHEDNERFMRDWIPQRDALPLATDRSVMLERFSACHPGAIFQHYKGPRYTVHALVLSDHEGVLQRDGLVWGELHRCAEEAGDRARLPEGRARQGAGDGRGGVLLRRAERRRVSVVSHALHKASRRRSDLRESTGVRESGSLGRVRDLRERSLGGEALAPNPDQNVRREPERPALVTFEVPGVPISQGSKTAGISKSGKAFMRESRSKQLEPWRNSVAWAARAAMEGPPWDGPIGLVFTFTFPRPKSVSPRSRPLPCVKPDVSKCMRAAEDALKGIVWLDDAQVCDGRVIKEYGQPGLIATIWRM